MILNHCSVYIVLRAPTFYLTRALTFDYHLHFPIFPRLPSFHVHYHVHFHFCLCRSFGMSWVVESLGQPMLPFVFGFLLLSNIIGGWNTDLSDVSFKVSSWSCGCGGGESLRAVM